MSIVTLERYLKLSLNLREYVAFLKYLSGYITFPQRVKGVKYNIPKINDFSLSIPIPSRLSVILVVWICII